MGRRLAAGVAAALVAAVLIAACGPDRASRQGKGGQGSGNGEGVAGGLTHVRLQLQWFTQAQFAGYIAARDKGFYTDVGLAVEILQGGTEIVPQTVLAEGRADFAVAWVPKALASREQGARITEVGQIFQRSGSWQVSFADAGIEKPADLRGRRVGTWGFGNEYELFAGITGAGLDPGADVTLVQQDFDVKALLSGAIDAGAAMSYNEYAQILEAVNPKTGKLYTSRDLSVIDWNEVGTAMLQDAVWASTSRLESDAAYRLTTTRFLEASMRGWAYCRDNAEECRDLVVAAGSQLGASHQLWQMNEVNKLIWPSPEGIGVVDEAAWARTVEIARGTRNAHGQTVLRGDPVGLAYTNEFTQAALANLRAADVDVTGESFEPVEVPLNPGGA
ncbi:NitT/TauT family transport system substrate-binding protein [Parafrankia irregularis]|uniref:Thiamine pyrimidine synthase n=1 Tax=Parafrankia irregularis TaxID=795642 RepID=A0A0S4QU07_9ACTN|nr:MULTISPECIES: ABC transporter substrate-binding protein [Parafrankia]MBE3202742.1 ABC transporter substrate-binding protein [Parafrankia sp. CH37]CUU57930.1 NitT/TauT family transport system substrate-binding protein [Parafrankia irregularis]